MLLPVAGVTVGAVVPGGVVVVEPVTGELLVAEVVVVTGAPLALSAALVAVEGARSALPAYVACTATVAASGVPPAPGCSVTEQLAGAPALAETGLRSQLAPAGNVPTVGSALKSTGPTGVSGGVSVSETVATQTESSLRLGPRVHCTVVEVEWRRSTPGGVATLHSASAAAESTLDAGTSAAAPGSVAVQVPSHRTVGGVSSVQVAEIPVID